MIYLIIKINAAAPFFMSILFMAAAGGFTSRKAYHARRFYLN